VGPAPVFDIDSISDGLVLKDDGIWYSRSTSDVAYPADGNVNCFEIEDQSFWFQHRNDCITTAVKLFPPQEGGAIYDVGGGNGYVTRGIKDCGFETVLVEPGQNGALNARRRGIDAVICSTLEDAHFRSDALTAVGVFDVIEHVQNDIAFLKNIDRILVPDGKLYITVPSYQFLWSSEDDYGGHYRRYTIHSLSQQLLKLGFRVDYATYIFRFLPIPIFLMRSIPYRLGIKTPITPKKVKSEHSLSAGLLQSKLQNVLRREISNIEKRVPMRFGGSCLIVASKRSD
jgi:SAM-dependent methyltransferase